jgi:hypothetical protein
MTCGHPPTVFPCRMRNGFMGDGGMLPFVLSSTFVSGVVTFVGCLMVPVLASAQQTLQFNVPYSCQDGYTRIITRCEKNARGGEVCFWREEQNGQLITERYNVRGQMDGWLATCKAPTAQPAATPRPPAPQAVAPAARSGQPLNPAYLAGMPSPDTVKQRIQGSSQVDTLARQVAVLNRLTQFIDRMRIAPERGGQRGSTLTPDERQLTNAYALASYQLSQTYIKSATPEAAKTFEQMAARYEAIEAADQMMGLLSAATIADYRRVSGDSSERAQARLDQQRRETEAALALPETPVAGGGPTMPDDPGAIAGRRCLELGGEKAECLGKGFTTGLLDLAGFGGGSPLAELMKGESRPGVRIGGTFATAGGLTLTFDSVNVNISSCGKLEPATRPYTVTKRGNQLQVEIDNVPRPLVVMLGPNNAFTGPAAFPITGQVITGYRSVYVEQRRVIDNLPVPGSGHYVQEPIYETKTLSCGFASLRATAPAQEEGTVIGSLAGAVGGGAPQSATSQAPAGPRMGGTYAASNGLKVEFRATAAIIDCGKAHVKKPYDVQNLADRVVVTVRNDNAPVTLTLQSDRTLAGSGSVDVLGRLATGVTDSGVTFVPHRERCALTTLTAQAQ